MQWRLRVDKVHEASTSARLLLNPSSYWRAATRSREYKIRPWWHEWAGATRSNAQYRRTKKQIRAAVKYVIAQVLDLIGPLQGVCQAHQLTIATHLIAEQN